MKQNSFDKPELVFSDLPSDAHILNFEQIVSACFHKLTARYQFNVSMKKLGQIRYQRGNRYIEIVLRSPPPTVNIYFGKLQFGFAVPWTKSDFHIYLRRAKGLPVDSNLGVTSSKELKHWLDIRMEQLEEYCLEFLDGS